MRRITLGNHNPFSVGQRQGTLNPRTLFANNEQGAAYLIGDANGASTAKQAWRRNLLTNSQRFTSWVGGSSNVTANNETAPDSTLTASTINRPGGSGYAITQANTLTLLPNTVYTLTIYIKAGTQTSAAFGVFSNSVGSFLSGTASVISGTASIGGTTPVQVTGLTSSWTRLQLTFTSASTGTSDVYFYPVSSSSSSGISGTNIIWGFQLELGSTPTDYQPITDFSTEFKTAFPAHALYQDSNGVTPCTAAGDPVGLILDQSRGGLGALGSELVTNGGFDSDTWWTKDAGIAITGGQAVFTSVAGGNGIYRSGFTVAGKWYRVTFTIASISAGGVRAYVTDTSFGPQVTSPGTYQHFILANSSNNLCGIFAVGTTSCTIDNISVREVPGNHAFQTVNGSRGTLCREPDGGKRNLLPYSEQFDVTTGGWQKGNVTITANTDIAPDGTNSGDTITTTVGGANPNVSQTVGYVTGQQYTFSVYLKAGNSTSCVLNVWGPGVGVFAQQTFTGLSSSWTRCVFTFTSTVTSASALISISPEGFITGTGKTVIAWGAQLELGILATQYQRNTTQYDCVEQGKRDCWSIELDGIDDSYLTNSVDFNTWTQATRRNLLVDTESFGASTWVKLNTTAADNTTETTDPLGTNTATKMTASSSTVRCAQNFTGRTAGENWVFSFHVKAGTATSVEYIISNGLAETNFSSGTFTFSNQTFGGSLGTYVTSRTATDVGNGWYRIVLVCTIPAGQTEIRFNPALPNVNTATAYYWGAQAELAGSATAYQRVGTDQLTIIAGMRKLNSITSIVAELSADAGSNDRSFYLVTGSNPTDGFWAFSRGTAGSTTSQGTSLPASPIETSIVSSLHDISGDLTTIRENGVSVATATGEKGSGNFGNYALFIGRRNNASLAFNGRIYGLIIRGVKTAITKVQEFEKYVSRITGSTSMFRGPLDNLSTNLESAWSVGRRLRAAYNGPVIRVRRSSDNAEQDFTGIGTTGAVDVASVASYCGVGNGFLTTIYDQSGLGRNLVQATAANQPLVVSSGVAQTQNGRLWAVFDGSTSSRRMTGSSSAAHYKSFHDGTSSTLYCVLNATNDANFKVPFSNIVAGTDIGFRCYLNGSEQPFIAAQNASGEVIGAQKSQIITTNVMTLFYDADNATAADREEGWLDGVVMTGNNALTGTPSSANASREFHFGSGATGSLPFNGAIGELVLWSADQTASKSVWESSAKTFWGTP